MLPNELEEALRADLRQTIRERLRQWLKDSMNLYEMGDVRKLHAFEDILYVLLSFTMHGISALELDPKATARIMEEMLVNAVEAKKARKTQKSTKEEST